MAEIALDCKSKYGSPLLLRLHLKFILIKHLLKKMLNLWLKKNPLLRIVRGSEIELPTPANISAMWNFGSLLGLCLSLQILTGLFFAIHYCGDVRLAFESVRHISRDVNYGWLLRIFNANGARFFFICLYLHVGRGLYYGSFNYIHYTYLNGLGFKFICCKSCSIFRVYFTLRLNIFFGGHIYY